MGVLSYLQGASFRLGSREPVNELLRNLMLMSSVQFYRFITVSLLNRSAVVVSNTVDVQWQKQHLTRHIQRERI